MARQWPDNICAGPICYGRAQNYDGFYLADVQHGIPTFGAVSFDSPPKVRGNEAHIFNYPGQTEQIAEQLVHRWNSYEGLLSALGGLLDIVEIWEGVDEGKNIQLEHSERYQTAKKTFEDVVLKQHIPKETPATPRSYGEREIFRRGGRYAMCQILCTWTDKPPRYIPCHDLEKDESFMAKQAMGTWCEVDILELDMMLNGKLKP